MPFTISFEQVVKKKKIKKFSQKKRPQQRTNQAPQRSIEDILRDLAGDTAPERTKEVFIEPEEIIVETATENTPRRPHTDSTPIKKVELSHDDEEDNSFDLRQAVINDAILNRPHQW